jgi:hypothetical protein
MVLDVELEPGASSDRCVFCAIVRGDAPAEIVLDDPAGSHFSIDARFCPATFCSYPGLMSRPFPICPSPKWDRSSPWHSD